MKTVKVLLLLLFVSCTAIESVEIVDGKYQKAYFAGGCFWCMEPPFEALEGVVEATSGYMGWRDRESTYEQVSMGNTGHAEVVEIEYDPNIITYSELLEVFLEKHRPYSIKLSICRCWITIQNRNIYGRSRTNGRST